MTTYETLLWFHVSFASLWVGGGIMMVIIESRAGRAANDERAYLLTQLEWLGTRFFAPVSLITLIFGVWLAIEGDWDFGAFWISASFTLFFVSFLTGAAFLGPTASKASKRLSEHGVNDAEAQRYIDRIFLVSRVDAFILLAVVYLMATKPGA